jgi:hypothetical protein
MLPAMSMFDEPTDSDRQRLANDLRDRGELVRRDGWGPYTGEWSTGQVVAVRAILGDADSVEAACSALASALWGIQGAEADGANGYPRTFGSLAEVSR